MERPRLSLTALVAVGGAVTPSPAELVPPGFDLASAQAVFTFVNFDGSTVTARLQGSNDDTTPTNWSDIQDATGTGLTADGIDMIGSGATVATQALFVGLFKWIRLNLDVAAPGAATEGQVVASVVSPGTVGSGQAGT